MTAEADTLHKEWLGGGGGAVSWPEQLTSCAL